MSTSAAPALSLRERAIAAHHEHEREADAARMSLAELRLVRRHGELIADLRRVLGIEVQPSDLHMMASGDQSIPAWKDAETGLVFCRQQVAPGWDGHNALYLVVWCAHCRQRSFRRVDALADLGRLLADPTRCWDCARRLEAVR